MRRVVDERDIELWVKVEGDNPGGSAKDRLAKYLIAAAERSGQLTTGMTIVEASAGNTGIGLALVAAVRGYEVVIVVPAGTSPHKILVARAYGARIHVCTGDEDYEAVAARLGAQPGWFRPNQFESSHNPEAHGRSTAAELWDELDGRIDAVIGTTGTGGTLAGLGRALKERDARIALVRAIPESDIGGESELEGVASEGPPPSFRCPTIDASIRVLDGAAHEMARLLARKEGLLVGGSSGAAVLAALRYADLHPERRRIVAILPDTGRNYAL